MVEHEITCRQIVFCCCSRFFVLKSHNSKDVTVFTSHFGVKFGLIICHEINFASPLRSMISAGVRDVIFPTQWGGSYGGNFAATQSGFAIAHQVTRWWFHSYLFIFTPNLGEDDSPF